MIQSPPPALSVGHFHFSFLSCCIVSHSRGCRYILLGDFLMKLGQLTTKEQSAPTRVHVSPLSCWARGDVAPPERCISATHNANAPLLPPAADSTGTHSLYTAYKDYEIMFHVSTLLPYTPNNKQQVKTERPACVRKPITPRVP